jgi:hypothetical protein
LITQKTGAGEFRKLEATLISGVLCSAHCKQEEVAFSTYTRLPETQRLIPNASSGQSILVTTIR